MKPARLRPSARDDRASEIRYYRKEAGIPSAERLLRQLSAALRAIERDPEIGSPLLGSALGIAGLRTWRVNGFPLRFWYLERADHLDVIRLIGERRNPETIGLD